MSTHNIGFYEEISKISLNYHQISSNTHLISSAENNKGIDRPAHLHSLFRAFAVSLYRKQNNCSCFTLNNSL